MTSTRLMEELKQTKPFANLEQEAFLWLVLVADRLQQATADLLKAHGLSPAQYNVLRILRGAGKDGLPCGAIAERMITRDPDITRLLDRLAKHGWVDRARDTADRRVVVARLTEAGRKLIAPLDQITSDASRSQLAHLDRKQLQQLIALLELVRHPPAG